MGQFYNTSDPEQINIDGVPYGKHSQMEVLFEVDVNSYPSHFPGMPPCP